MSENNQEQNQIPIDLTKISPYMAFSPNSPIRRMAPKIGRNETCPKTSKKFKNCCGADGSKHCKEEYKTFLEAMQKHLEERNKNQLNTQDNNA